MRIPGTLSTGFFLVVTVANASPGPAGQVPAPSADGERVLHDVASPDVPLATILDRAGAYVTRYSDTFRNVLAEETCRQLWLRGDWGRGSTRDDAVYGSERGHQTVEMRSLRSEIVWVGVPGPQPWGIFRDVVELNGQKLESHEGRLEKLFASPSPTALQQAREILDESSHYDLGPRRDVNLPTLALLWLLPENQGRLELERKGERTIASLRGVEVKFREVASPTLVRDRRQDRDIPSSGRFWIDPTSGAVLRSEILYVGRGSVSTEYRSEPGFDVRVPDVMEETSGFKATARYAKYRRFDVPRDANVAKEPEAPRE
jgi:hypothetical protein